MQIVNRDSIIEQQPRAFTYGNIELINDEWIFFDEEDDEAFLLVDEIENNEIELLVNNIWAKVQFFKEDGIFFKNNELFLPQGSPVRFRKKLMRGFQLLLNDLDDSSFLEFIHLIKQADYSIFDCFFCHYSFEFHTKKEFEGVNFLLLDNGIYVSSLHHYYIRSQTIETNRFELTQSNGLKLFT